MRILIVDDDQVMLQLLTDTLKYHELECEIVTTTNGPEGVELFHQGSFDIVVADTNVFPQYGLKVLEEVKKTSPTTKTLSIVRVTHNFQEVLNLEYVDCALLKSTEPEDKDISFSIHKFVATIQGWM